MTMTSEVPAHRPLKMWHTRREQTTRLLVRRAESYLLFAQGIWIIVTSFLDKVNPEGQYILIAIAGLHFAAALFAYRHGGPFFNGGAWIWLWVGAALLIPLVMAGLVPIGEYGASTACFQLCGYPVAPIVFLAFYPWLGIANDDLRPAISALVVVAIAAMPLAIMVGINGDLSPANWAAWANGASGYVLAYIGGLMFGAITREAANAQVGAQQEAYSEIFDTLHNNVNTALDAVRRHHERGEQTEVEGKLRALNASVMEARDRLTLAQETVSLTELLGRQVSHIVGLVDRVETSRMGIFYVRMELGIMINHAIGALIRNAIAHPEVQYLKVDARIIDGEVLLVEVCDDGPGFDDEILDDPSTSLHKLRERIRDLNGDLVKLQSDHFSTCMQVWAPLYDDG